MADFRFALALVVVSLLSASSSAYVTSIHVPAVLVNQNVGDLTLVTLNVTAGNGGVQVNGPQSVDADTLASAQTAATYASSFLGLNEKKYNFNYTIMDASLNVSGPSAGLAFTLLAVSALQGRQLAQNFTVTGTISGDGSVGLIGGVTDKTGAAAAKGMHFILVPYAQNDSEEDLLYYISQQTYGLPVVEVANVSQALPYAYGEKAPVPLSINLTQTFNIGAIGNANITCSACNISAFAQLSNFTLNLTTDAISSIGSNFSSAKQQLGANVGNYRQLASDGFLYTAADFSFLTYINAFTLANEQNYTSAGAASLLSNVSSFCSSLVPPPLTTQNYEFVIGGELRQYWANQTIANAEQQLTSEQTTDDIIGSISTAASAMGWCQASAELYSIAPYLGGNYVQVSPSLRTTAASAINKARSNGSGLYLQTALQAYNDGNYAAALYSATYASTFSQPVPNESIAQLYAQSQANIANATSGLWPSQFATQSEFYFRQSLLSKGANETGYADQAYTTALLASGLAAANSAVNSSFVISNQPGSAVSQQLVDQISSIEQSISQIYVLLLVNAFLLFVVLVVLLVHILPKKNAVHARQKQR